jgi:membrane protease YdiL (CAAX protease family)
MPSKLTAREFRIITAGLLIAGASLAIGIKYFRRAFPEASISFRVNRDDSEPRARNFLAAREAKLTDTSHAAIFSYDDQAKVYLERTQGLDRLDALTNGPVHLWRWSHRWFKPQKIEEYRVDVAPSGEVVGYEHVIPEDAAGASLEESAVRAIAEKFLVEAMHRDLASLDFVETRTEKRKDRTDFTFTWKQKGLELRDGSWRLQVEVDGDQVNGYREYLEVPEQWSRDYEELRSKNDIAQVVAEVFLVLLTLAMGGLLVLRLRDRDAPMRMAAVFGLVAVVLYFFGQLNDFSLAKFGYHTRDPYSSFLAQYLLSAALSAFGLGVWIFFLVGSSEPAYRQNFPHLQSLRKTFSWQGIRSRSFFMANVVGLTLTFFFFAYQTIFYLVANKLGAWAPADPKYSDLLNTRWPWIWVLFMGFVPAVTEETQFRAFAIPFLGRLFRWRPAGVFLAAFMWSFLHSAYPNQPFFIRGLEVGMGGIIIGFVMLRFGIVATMIWHYSVDALYTAFLLLRSGNHYLMGSGGVTAGIMMVPLVVALVAYLRSGSFTDDEALTNASAGISRRAAEVQPAEAAAVLAYQPLPLSRIWAGAGLTAAFIAVAFIPAYEFGKGVVLRTPRAEALRLADADLKSRGADPEKYRRAAWLDQDVDPLSLRYLLERRSVEESDRIIRQASKLLLWEVRYFRPLEKEEYRVMIDADAGKVYFTEHLMDEGVAGPMISPDAAKALSESFLAARGTDLSKFELQGLEVKQPEKLQHFTVTWQAKAGEPMNVGDAKFRLEVNLAGGQVTGFRSFFKLPEDWERARKATSLFNGVMIGLLVVAGGAIFGVVIFLFVRQVRAGAIRWRRSLVVGAAFFVTMLLGELDELPVLAGRYDTSIPLASFWTFVSVSLFVLPLVTGVAVWLLAGLATSLYPDSWRVFAGPSRRAWRRDAVAGVALWLAASAALGRVATMVAGRFHTFAPISVGLLPLGLDGFLPGVAYFFRSLQNALLLPLLAALLIYLVRRGIETRPWWMWPLALLILMRLGPASAHSRAEFFLGWATSAITLAGAVLIAATFFRDNILAYFAAAFAAGVVEPLISLFSAPPAFYRWNGGALALLVALMLGWMFLPRASPRQPL